MPLCFAYGSNMDVGAMARRCPGSAPLGRASLANFRFFISRDGYASVRPSAGAVVHGLAWRLSVHDGPSLDRYEAVALGLYRKAALPIRLGSRRCRALVYIGRSVLPGSPVAGYMDLVLAAAEALQLPSAYRDQLSTWCFQ